MLFRMPAAQLTDEGEQLALDAVALDDRVVDGARLGFVEDGRGGFDGLAGRPAAQGAGRQRHPRRVADPLDLPRFLLGDDQQSIPAVGVQGGPDGNRLGPAVLGEGGQQQVLRLGKVRKGRGHGCQPTARADAESHCAGSRACDSASARRTQASRSPSVSSSTWRNPSRVSGAGCAHRPRPAASNSRSAMPCSAHGLDSVMNVRFCASRT